MVTSGGKKPAPKAAKPAPSISRPVAKKPSGLPPGEHALPLKGKKVAGGAKNVTPPAPVTGEPPVAQPVAPAPEPVGNEKPLCWIELVKSGSVFIARSSTTGGTPKEYKNRVLEDMLTELIVELQEEIQE